ncbi:MAG: prepilin-type N-terminal cleavage/methylation domain-containing protein [Gammaproteobacteria bacterium]|nr:prepilin-type N-terminal cleavage/methylation domain-containing protein [Gammaproteobacteria bacterium]
MNLKLQSGFTLIELVIAVAIVGIIASLALSYFGDNVISARRTDGRSVLLSNATRLEKCKATYGVYDNAACTIDATSSDGYYTVAVVSDATTFTLTASPAGAQTSDADCTSIILDNLGQQTGTGADSVECW